MVSSYSLLICRSLTALLVAANLGTATANSGNTVRGFLSPSEGHSVTTAEVRLSLQEALQAAISNRTNAAAQQLASVESRIWHTFQSLPKNDVGRLAPRAVRYIVHNYFAREHGWLILGLEPHGNQDNISEVHNINIFQDKAPVLIESLLETRRGNHGLALQDVVAMIASLERLILDESLSLLQSSYTLNGFDSIQTLDGEQIHEVLSSYLLLFELGHNADLTNADRHQRLKAAAEKSGGNWPMLVQFEQDAVSNYNFDQRHRTNPFVEPSYSFQALSVISEGLVHGFGKWQNTECRQMKEELMSLDPDGSGRVPLPTFYSQPETAQYQFTESLSYLRKIGALDETGNTPKVRISNYVAGPSNCIATSSYYSVCCLSECEGLLNELEAQVLAPRASVSRLLSLVRNMSSLDSAPRLTLALTAKLDEIAGQHGGEVPLHGRLFAQWLHHVFPNECPYPEVTSEAAALTPNYWLDKTLTASKEERMHYSSMKVEVPQSNDGENLSWSDEELLHAHEPTHKASHGTFTYIFRCVMQVTLLLTLMKVGFDALRSLHASGFGGSGGKKYKDECELLF